MADETETKKLNDMLDSLIHKKDEQAQVHFHSYLEDKMKDVLTPVVVKDDSSVDDKE